MRDVAGYEGIYQVTEAGRIWRKPRFVEVGKKKPYTLKGKWMSLSGTPDGYVVVGLRKRHTVQDRFYVHRLVAIAYLPNEKNLPSINHKNSDRTDNRVENLEWCTAKENTHHAIRMGKFDIKGERHPKAILTDEKVREIRRLRKEKVPAKKIGRLFNLSPSYIYKLSYRQLWKHI